MLARHRSYRQRGHSLYVGWPFRCGGFVKVFFVFFPQGTDDGVPVFTELFAM